MTEYGKLEVGDIFVIPKGTEFFSIALQESVIATRDIVIKLTHTCVPENNYVFGMIQVVLLNLELSIAAKKDMTTFLDHNNGGIGISYLKLKKYISKNIAS